MRQFSYALDAPGRRHREFSELAKEEAFRNASTVYPVQTPEDFYRLHAYYSKVSQGKTMIINIENPLVCSTIWRRCSSGAML